MLLVVSFISVLMFVYSNTLMYCVGLLVLASVVLLWIVLNGFLSVLVFLLISLVYMGAVMILVGYVCAVSPNIVLSESHTRFLLYFLPISLYFLEGTPQFSNVKIGSLSDYFLTEWGLLMFLFVVVILFIVLLIVTFQFFSPQGPLRSN